MEVVIKAIIFGFFLYVMTKAFAPKGRQREETGTKWVSQFSAKTSFVAMEYFQLIRNRTLRVFVENDFICGIFVGGDMATQGAEIQEPGKDPEYFVNEYYEKKYTGIEIGSEAMLNVNKANFKIMKEDIVDITYKKFKFGMVGTPYSGRLILKLKNGKKKELILLGSQDPEKVKTQILSRLP